MSELFQGLNLNTLLSLNTEDKENIRVIIDEILQLLDENEKNRFSSQENTLNSNETTNLENREIATGNERRSCCCNRCSSVRNDVFQNGALRLGSASSFAAMECSRAQMRNMLSQIIKCFENAEIALTLYDGTRMNNLRLLDICPDCNPMYVKVQDCTANRTRVFLVESIAQLTIFTTSNLPRLRVRRCRCRCTNPITASLCQGKEVELIVNGNHCTSGVVREVCSGMVVLASNNPGRIDFISSAALIGFTSC